jgi:hypothetical protein
VIFLSKRLGTGKKMLQEVNVSRSKGLF